MNGDRIDSTAQSPDKEMDAFPQIFVPDRITGMTARADELMYFIKWTGKDGDALMPADEANSRFPQTVLRYYQHQLGGIGNVSELKDIKEADGQVIEEIGFDRGLEPLKVVGALNASDGLKFIIQWEGSDIMDLVPASQANIKCPLIIIRFYEDQLRWLFQ